MKRPKPTSLAEVMERLRLEMPTVRRRFGVKSLHVFGSYARGVQRTRSDVDLLVEFDMTPGFFDFIRLENHLSDTVGAKVDLISRRALRGEIGDRILSEKVPV